MTCELAQAARRRAPNTRGSDLRVFITNCNARGGQEFNPVSRKVMKIRMIRISITRERWRIEMACESKGWVFFIGWIRVMARMCVAVAVATALRAAPAIADVPAAADETKEL